MAAGSLKPENATIPTGMRAADEFIASLGGDARTAVVQLLELVGTLQRENASLVIAASRGYARAGILAGEVMRYKGQITQRIIDREYPHQVEILSDNNLGPRLMTMHEFCRGMAVQTQSIGNKKRIETGRDACGPEEIAFASQFWKAGVVPAEEPDGQCPHCGQALHAMGTSRRANWRKMIGKTATIARSR